MAMELLDFPNEILKEIAEWLWEEADLNAFLRTNRRLFNLLDTCLYSHNLHRMELDDIWENNAALVKTADRSGPEATYRKALEAINARDTSRSKKLAEQTLYRVINAGQANFIKIHLAVDDAFNPEKHPQINKNPFIRSCSQKNTEIFWILAKSPLFDANAEDQGGSTPLMGACGWGHVEPVRFLLEHGANVNAQDDNGFTPLYNAAENGEVEILKLLVATGNLKLNVCTKGGATALWRANYLNKREATLFLAKQPGVDCYIGDRLGYSPIQIAVLNGDIELLEAMVEGGVDINYDPHECGNTIVTFAAAQGCVEALKFLLSVPGAQVNPKPGISCWPLGVAAHQGHARIIEVLLEYPDTIVDATDENGNTPLLITAHLDHKEATEVLLASYKLDINKKCSRGYTALGAAVEKQNVSMIRRLLAVPGIDPELRNDFDHTTLDIAVRLGDVECAKTLLECAGVANGSAVRLKDNPYEKAKAEGKTELEALLKPYYDRRVG
ncbi:unnamed protein product [Clonostachys rhizophaga]|uniref:Uncharacterized protein n=1 Tax=Clonostachys rhizophaga TaxID=160324 RepID=A0A9N9YS27_9HYPO|nr:unnamed protein product [Clonostachys rhizophaga]